MCIRLNIKHLAIGGGKNEPSSYVRERTRLRHRNPLTFFSLATLVALIVVPALAACSEGDEPSRTKPDAPATRAMTREDSIRAGLIITVDTAWDGVIQYQP